MDIPPCPIIGAWHYRHGWVMLVGLASLVGGAPLISLFGLAALSFSALTYGLGKRWTPAGNYGVANFVTMGRFCLVGVMLWYALPMPLLAVGLAIAVLLLDGVDGWLARRSGSISAYGEALDKEVDAFLTLALCSSLYRSDQFGVWILVPGALRYLFVLFIRYAAPPSKQETATRWSRTLGAFTLASLMVSMLPLGAFSVWAGGAATATVIASFARSLRQLYSTD